MCERICPSFNQIETHYPSKGFVGRHIDSHIFFNSASGGAFSAILERIYGQIHNEDLFVIGAAFTKNFNVKHIVLKYPHIYPLLNSKYVLSCTDGCFKKGKELLQSGKWVVFSGTPCQVAAFKTSLGCEYDKLICVDIVCHGAPNQEIFDEYRSEMEKRVRSSIVGYSFHSKKINKGKVNTRSVYIRYANNRSGYYTARNDPYLKMYYNRIGYRPSCYHCKFSSPYRVSDITLGDAWGIEQLYPDLISKEGVSCILLNSRKGLSLFNASIQDISMLLKTVDINFAIHNNQQLQCPTPEPDGNKKFLLNFKKKSYIRAVAIAAFPNIVRRILFYTRCVVANFLYFIK